MRKYLVIFYFICSLPAWGQFSFKTIVPQKPIIEGEAFQVQYILQDAKKAGLVTAPPFRSFRFVSGPNIYFGNVTSAIGDQTLHNVVYTLEAIKPGIFIIPGATVTVNGKQVRSNDAKVEVISREEAARQFNRENSRSSSEFFLKPGEDPYKKIRENLFVKVMVNKQNCLVGEPVQATFKLYSRLESKSDIVKNPGFYGFTVYDMVNLADNEVSAEKINGKLFDVHTIRKVQLYPLQAGNFVIDAMEVKNRVVFSSSAINKQTEQEIVEGMLDPGNTDLHSPGTEEFESATSTEPVTIHVDALPAKNKPAVFSGALGQFSIRTSVPKNEFDLNEQGIVELIISGNGNFTQLDAPVIQWPAGLEGFEAHVSDQIDKMSIPLRGSRSFLYPFVGVSPGNFNLPAIKFSFFDPDSNLYRTVQTDSVEINISNKVKVSSSTEENQFKNKAGKKWIKPVVAVFILLSLLVFTWKFRHFFLREKTKPQDHSPIPDSIGTDFDLDPADEKFYANVYHALWKTAATKFELSGSSMNKQVLNSILQSNQVSPTIVNEIDWLIRQCEVGMFTGTTPEQEKPEILERAKLVARSINRL